MIVATVVLRQTGGIDRRARNNGGRRRLSTNARRDSRPLLTYWGGPRGTSGWYEARLVSYWAGSGQLEPLKSIKTRLVE